MEVRGFLLISLFNSWFVCAGWAGEWYGWASEWSGSGGRGEGWEYY